MWFVIGLRPLDGKITWHCRRDPTNQEEGLTVTFDLGLSSKLAPITRRQQRQMLDKLKRILEENSIPWIVPDDEEWSFDLDALKDFFGDVIPDLASIGWFKGHLLIEPEFEIEQRVDFQKLQYSTKVFFRIVPPENPAEHLLKVFDDLGESQDSQRRGYQLQRLLNETFELYRIHVVKSFMRNRGAEQIDGAFKLEGWHYIVECRWRKKPANTRELDGLQGQVTRSGKQTMGLFLSINGWSDNVPGLLKQNQQKSIILMNGDDLRSVLSGKLDLREFILLKIQKLNLEGEPFYGAAQYLENHDNA